MYLYLANCSAAKTVQTFIFPRLAGVKNGHLYKFLAVWLAAFVRVAGKAGAVFILVPPREVFSTILWFEGFRFVSSNLYTPSFSHVLEFTF